MAITKEVVIAKIEVVGTHKFIQIAKDTVIKRALRKSANNLIKEDGTQISRKRHRHHIAPNISSSDLSKEDSQVQGIANIVWTDEVKSAYLDSL